MYISFSHQSKNNSYSSHFLALSYDFGQLKFIFKHFTTKFLNSNQTYFKHFFNILNTFALILSSIFSFFSVFILNMILRNIKNSSYTRLLKRANYFKNNYMSHFSVSLLDKSLYPLIPYLAVCLRKAYYQDVRG